MADSITTAEQPDLRREKTVTPPYKPVLPSPSAILDAVLWTPADEDLALDVPDGICAICREELSQPRQLPCNHIFCNGRLRATITRNHSAAPASSKPPTRTRP